MRRGIFDIETDGLLDEVTRVHCIAVVVVNERGDVLHQPTLYAGYDIHDGLRLLDTCDVIVAHNGIAYDVMVLWDLYRWKPKAAVEDTLILGRLLYPDRPGGYSLESWGEELGCEKFGYEAWWEEKCHTICRAYDSGNESLIGELERELNVHADEFVPALRASEVTQWTFYNDTMGSYCLQDVNVSVNLDKYLQNTRFSDPRMLAAGRENGWEESYANELEFARHFAMQGRRGVKVDVDLANSLVQRLDAEMAEIQARVEPLLPAKTPNKGQLKSLTPPTKQFKADGTPNAITLKWFDKVVLDQSNSVFDKPVYRGLKFGEWWELPTASEIDDDGNRVCLPLRFDVPMRLSDQDAIKDWLMDQGWVPTTWNYKKAKNKWGKYQEVKDEHGKSIPTSPKLHEGGELCPGLAAIQGAAPVVQDVVQWLVCRHRRGLVTSILDGVRKDGRISATGASLGTPTGRVTHKRVANIPKADIGDDGNPVAYLGPECRALFTASDGCVLAGVDASGLELRMLAHYSGSQDLVDIILTGTKENGREIHTLLYNKCYKPLGGASRGAGKSTTYAWLYGALDPKLGATLGVSGQKATKAGKMAREAIVKTLPGMDKLMNHIAVAAKRGYVFSLDGRIIPIRSPHAALNTLLQSAGSIVVKAATSWMMRQIYRQRIHARMVIHYHDEVVLDCLPQEAMEAANLFIEGLRVSGEKMGVRCPLDGEAKIGGTWAEAH